MNVKQEAARWNQTPVRRRVLATLLAGAVGLALALPSSRAANVTLWDTGTPLAEAGIPPGRTG